MATFEFTSPEGKVYTVDGPAGSTKEQAFQILQTQIAAPGAPTEKPSFMQSMGREALNSIPVQTALGALRGTASIGNTILPGDRKAGIEGGMQALGGNPDSMAYGAGKIGAEIAGTAGIGGLAAKGLSAIPGVAQAAPSLINALKTSGMTTGAAPANFLSKAGLADMAIRTGAGAAVGGASAAAVGDNPMMGAVIGGVTPGALQLVGGVAKAAGNAFSNKAAENTVVERVRGVIGKGTPGNLSQTGDIPLSAAARTQSPELARMEQGSRLRNPETWYDFDQKQGKAVFDKVTQATDDAALVAPRAAARSANWKANWADVEKSVDPQVFTAKIPEFNRNLDVALQSAESANPAVKSMLETIKGQLSHFGDNFSPAHLQQIRANLSGKYNPMSPNAFASAPRDSKATQDVLREVDNILNESTGGVWAKVPAAYKADSTLLHQAKAASKVRGGFVDADTGRTLGVSLDPMGDIPKITEAGLGRAMNAARMPVTQKLALSQPAEQELSTVLDALRKQNIVQGVKRSASAGGGSDTSSNVMALAPGGTTKNIINQLVGAVKEAGNNKTNSRLAELLSDPDSLNLLLQTPAKQQNSVLKQLLYRAAPVAIAQ